MALFETVDTDRKGRVQAPTGRSPAPMRVPLDVKALDDLLGGGVESGALTEFHGEAGAGKTNLCLQLARNVARAGKKAIYIDTEGVSIERLRQMCGADFDEVRDRILFFEPYDAGEQERIIEKSVRLAEGNDDIGLIILDSATLFYRLGLGAGDNRQDRRDLTRQLHDLHAAARRRSIPVVMTNQVYTNIDDETIEPLGGNLLKHLAKALVRLEKANKQGMRRAIIVKHRAQPEGKTALFKLGSTGLEEA